MQVLAVCQIPNNNSRVISKKYPQSRPTTNQCLRARLLRKNCNDAPDFPGWKDRVMEPVKGIDPSCLFLKEIAQ
jgi:hypothetical protein